MSKTFVDGHGRTRISISDLPNAPSGTNAYSAVITEYDKFGRVKRQTTPTETLFINGTYQPAGDDAANMPGRSADGWLWTSSEYDWKSRVVKSINTDGTFKTISYTGCGCAGGEITTIEGEQLAEGKRKQKIYADSFGRTYKTEILDWQGNIYKTVVDYYNERDQVISTREYAGIESVNEFRGTIFNFDGHGRLQSRHIPEQDANKYTTYTYFPDDKPHTITDGRGATKHYQYNNRGLIQQISWTIPQNSNIQVPATATFNYNNLGNRTQMFDGLGNVMYEYNSLSQLIAETRQFNETVPFAPLPDNKFKIQYGYGLSGQLTSLTEPFGEIISYGHDKTGRLKTVSGNRTNVGATHLKC